MPVPVEAVLFDFGGVLSTSPFGAFERHEQTRGLPAWARLERNDVDFDQFCDTFEAEAVAAGGTVDARELFATMTGEMRPEMLEAVRRCHAHFKTGLLTNNFITPTTTARHAEVLDLFDVAIQSAVVGVRKPDPRFYLMACDALEIEPSAAVFLDDLGVNLKPARALGMQTIKVVDPNEALIELEAVVGIPLRSGPGPRSA